MYEAKLEGANLFRTNLIEAYLRAANLSEATIIWADLTGADLSNAWLTKALLLGTKLGGANLQYADLCGARANKREPVPEKQLTECKTLKGATMPNGQKYEDWKKSRGEDGG